MMASHYAPNAAVRLDAASVRPDEALLAFGSKRARGGMAAKAVLNLSETGDLREAAANLYAHLIALDRTKPSRIAVEPIPDTGLATDDHHAAGTVHCSPENVAERLEVLVTLEQPGIVRTHHTDP